MKLPRREFPSSGRRPAPHPRGPCHARPGRKPGRRRGRVGGAIVIGFTAGGAFDLVGRLMAQWLSDRLGQQFIVENRPGRQQQTSRAEAVVLAPPDGHTLLIGGATNAINTTLYPKLTFDFIRGPRTGCRPHPAGQRDGSETRLFRPGRFPN